MCGYSWSTVSFSAQLDPHFGVPCPCKKGLFVLTSNLALHGHLRCEGSEDRNQDHAGCLPTFLPGRIVCWLTRPVMLAAERQLKQDMAIFLKARRLSSRICEFCGFKTQPLRFVVHANYWARGGGGRIRTYYTLFRSDTVKRSTCRACLLQKFEAIMVINKHIPLENLRERILLQTGAALKHFPFEFL